MRRLILSAKYGEEFTHKKIPRLFLKLIVSELHKSINIPVLLYIKETYDIDKDTIIQLLYSNLRVSGYLDNVIIDFYPVVVKQEITDDGPIKIIYLETLIDLINYGNLKVKGSNSIHKVIGYIQTNINTLYRLSRMRGGSAVWQ